MASHCPTTNNSSRSSSNEISTLLKVSNNKASIRHLLPGTSNNLGSLCMPSRHSRVLRLRCQAKRLDVNELPMNRTRRHFRHRTLAFRHRCHVTDNTLIQIPQSLLPVRSTNAPVRFTRLILILRRLRDQRRRRHVYHERWNAQDAAEER